MQLSPAASQLYQPAPQLYSAAPEGDAPVGSPGAHSHYSPLRVEHADEPSPQPGASDQPSPQGFPAAATAPPSVSGGGLQSGVTRVQQELNKRGGKYGAWLGNQLQVQADALKTVPIVGDVHSRGTAISFHVFKAGGLFSKDDVVTTEDRNTPVFYLDFPRAWRSSWNLTLHRGGREGPVVCSLLKGSYGFTANDIRIAMSNGWTTVLAKPSLISSAHEFTGFDGVTKFKWKSDGLLASTMTCIDNSNGQVAATWTKSYAFGKDGSLLVSPTYHGMLELLVATALAMEEWRREEAERGGEKSKLTSMAGMGMAAFNKLKK